MSTNELPREKRTADESITSELTIPDSPPVHPESMLNDCEPDDPPRTRLILTGLSREEITAEFLVGIHDLAEEHDLNVESISVGEPDE